MSFVVKPKMATKKESTPKKQVLKTIKIVDYVKKTGSGDTDFVIKQKCIVEETDLFKFLQAQADDVGVHNIMRKVALTGDHTILEGLKDTGSDIVQDYTQMPETLAEAYQIAEQGRALYGSLSEEIKAGMSFEDFMTNFDIRKFIKKADTTTSSEITGEKGE